MPFPCVLSVRLGEALGLSESELHEVYYLALLRHIGCNAETYRMSDVFGDELALRTQFATVDSEHTSEVMGLVIRSIQHANEGGSVVHLARMIAQGLLTTPHLMKEGFTVLSLLQNMPTCDLCSHSTAKTGNSTVYYRRVLFTTDSSSILDITRAGNEV